MQDQMLIRPSLSAMFQAAELGCEMAAEDHSVRPDLGNAHHYAGYRQFRDAHRERWERSEVFVHTWQERLFILAEKEGNRLGLRMDDLMSSWDTWYSQLVVPLKSVFWTGWERSCELPRRFVQATHACGTKTASCPMPHAVQWHSWHLTELCVPPTTSDAAHLC